MSREAMKLALEAAYLAGWNASGEGYNAEYPFGDHARNPEEDAAWIKNRDNALREALAEQPARPYRLLQDNGSKYFGDSWDKAEQPAQQEPVAWNDEQLQMLNFLYGAGDFDGVWFDQKHPTEKGAFWWRKHLRRLFDTPQAQPAQRKPLTDEEINEMRQQFGVSSDGRGIKEFTYVRDFARAIEASHGIKGNT